MSREGVQWLIARDVLYAPPLPDNVKALLKKIDARQAWNYDDAVTILGLAHNHPVALETLWRRLSGNDELSDYVASLLLAEIVERIEE